VENVRRGEVGRTKKDRCHLGHDDWRTRPDKTRECRTCKNLTRAAWRKRTRKV
jgi:hypothetical protein